MFEGVFSPPTLVFACMGVMYGENKTRPGRDWDCVVPGVEIMHHPGLLTGSPLQKFQPCEKENEDPDWDWNNPNWKEGNTCGPYGQKCKPLSSCTNPDDWDTCPQTRYRVMITENTGKHTYPALMWFLYFPTLALFVYLTVLVIMFICVPFLKNCMGMTDEEIFDLAGAEEDMGPELEDGDDEEGALEKVRKLAARKVKVAAWKSRVKQ